ncbi:MAG: ABC transporter permease subunit [Lachnospiraceae bacterium]|nr:ABC transporter permease subunit [Lachnospiraceae bacterium]MBQ3907482.1 ABC transporter permease subunit [Lachnospiraceae bacterium]
MKKFFQLQRGAWLEFGLATILMIVNIVLTLTFPYFTKHKAYYDSAAYIAVLFGSFVIYVFSLFWTKKKSTNDIAVVLYGFFILWEVSYKLGWVHNDLLIPSPEGLFHVFVEKGPEIGKDVWGSIQLLFWGFLLAAVFGTLLGLLAGWIPRVREVLLPISNVITLIPPLMFSAYMIMILSTFRQAAIAVIFFAVFWPTFQGTVVRVGQIDPSITQAARTMGVGTLGMLGKVIFPYCLPGIIGSISKSLRGAFMCLAGAEMLGINLGIGFFIEKYKSFADYRCVLAGIVTVGFITTVIDLAVNKLKAALIRWEN